jgi:hypothetical protein
MNLKKCGNAAVRKRVCHPGRLVVHPESTGTSSRRGFLVRIRGNADSGLPGMASPSPSTKIYPVYSCTSMFLFYSTWITRMNRIEKKNGKQTAMAEAESISNTPDFAPFRYCVLLELGHF